MRIPRLSPSLLVAVLAVVLATSATSFAAGLAAGSVGTAQLRDRAVTAPKIAVGAVSSATVRDRSIGAPDLAPGAVPRTTLVSRTTGESPERQVLALRGLRFTYVCNTVQRLSQLVVTPSSGRMDRTGNEVVRSGSTQYPRSIVYPSNTISVFGEPAAPDTSASVTFDGLVQAAGSRAAVRITVGVQWSPSSSTPCTLRMAATPTA